MPGLTVLAPEATHFRELVVRLDSARTRDVLGALLDRGILGGADLTRIRPDLGESLLVCVTETTTRESIDLLARALTEILDEGNPA